MDINRYNYEEYFLLYTDNELNDREREAVEEFAAMNPDLQGELALLQQYKMDPEEIAFPGKETLMKTARNHFINENNWEECFLLYTDKQLNDDDKAQVEQFVHDHPALKPDFELISKAVLTPNESIRFLNKQELLRYEDKVVSIAWWKVAAAAVLILAAGSLWLNTRPAIILQQPVAHQAGSSSPKQLLASGSKPAENQSSHGSVPLTGTAYAIASEKPAASKIIQHQKKKHTKGDDVKSVARLDNNLHPVQVQIQGNPEQVHPANSIALNRINSSVIKQQTIMDEPATLINMADFAGTKPDNITFASNNDAEDVYISNIPLDKNHALRGLFRKASRIIDKATGLSTSEKGIHIGNLEIAL